MQEVLDDFSKEKAHYPVIILYEKLDSIVFKRINSLEKILRESNEVLRLSKLSINITYNSYFLDMYQKAMRNSMAFVKEDKIIIIDSFLPIIPDFNINCAEFVNFISKFDDIESKINKYNTKLILGMTYKQWNTIPVQNSMLRRYKGIELDIQEFDEENIKNKRFESLTFDKKFLPTINMSSLWSNNPFYSLLNKQIKECQLTNTKIDSVLNLIQNFESIDLLNFKDIFRVVFSEEICRDDITAFHNNPYEKKNIPKIQAFNIIQFVKYLYLIQEIFDIKMRDGDLQLIIP